MSKNTWNSCFTADEPEHLFNRAEEWPTHVDLNPVDSSKVFVEELSGGARRSGRCDEATTAAYGFEDDSGDEDPNDSELKGDSEGSTIDSSSRATVIHSFAHISTAAMDKPYAESSVSTPRTY